MPGPGDPSVGVNVGAAPEKTGPLAGTTLISVTVKPNKTKVRDIHVVFERVKHGQPGKFSGADFPAGPDQGKSPPAGPAGSPLADKTQWSAGFDIHTEPGGDSDDLQFSFVNPSGALGDDFTFQIRYTGKEKLDPKKLKIVVTDTGARPYERSIPFNPIPAG